MATLSSGGTAPNGAVVDLAAPGYVGLAVAGKGQDPPLPTESFGGTSQSAPFISGAAADVIQAYRDTHGGATPTPAEVKQILTSTATDIGAPSDQQGAGLLNVYAAVLAARQMPGTSQPQSTTPELVDTPSQLDVQGPGGSTVHQSVSLYNASSNAESVTGAYRVLGSERTLDKPVTETVSAPSPSAPIPAQGATAAAPITFTVPSGVDVLDADMRWPDPTNGDDNILTFLLTDPAGRVAQSSYDYGASNGPNASPDIQHSTVQHPMAGKWTAQVLWANGRGHVQSPPDVPGSYTGTVTFQAGGQNFTTSPASPTVTIPAHTSVSVPLSIRLPEAAGDAPELVQFTGPNGLESSVPVARRSLIRSSGGSFSATLTSSVSRNAGQIQTFYLKAPKGEKDLDVTFKAPDHSANDPVYYYLFYRPTSCRSSPSSGFIDVTATDATPTPDNPTGNASLIATDPQAGFWEIDVMQGATTDGTEFSQTVTGVVAYDQLAPVTEHGLPTSTSRVIHTGSSVSITVSVTNTTNHVGLFELLPTGDDISGGNTSAPEELAPGATGTLTATLSPTASAGTKVHGFLSVIDSTDWEPLTPRSAYQPRSPTSTTSPTPTWSEASPAAGTATRPWPGPRFDEARATCRIRVGDGQRILRRADPGGRSPNVNETMAGGSGDRGALGNSPGSKPKAGELVTETLLEYDGGRQVTVYVPPDAPEAAHLRRRRSGILEVGSVPRDRRCTANDDRRRARAGRRDAAT